LFLEKWSEHIMKTGIGVVVLAVALFESHALAGDTVSICNEADGSVLLSNQTTGKNCVPVTTVKPSPSTAEVAAPVGTGKNDGPREEPAAENSPAPAVDRAAKSAPGTDLTPLEAKLSKYRDTMLESATKAQDATATAKNPAVTRRYLKMDRSTYMSKFGVSDTPQ
jgi:hypothetical protein